MRLFLDSSVLYAAFGSRTGGSARIVALAQDGVHTIITSETCLAELMRHIDTESIASFHQYIHQSQCIVMESIQEVQQISFAHLVLDPDDVHVIAGAVLSHSSHLITLDKKHIDTQYVRTTMKKDFAVIVSSPGLYLQRLI